ncbi:hypothetical protein [Paenibacillus sp. URB8-2]|uniref:hypothetical protein n=1 Tax=Paenibacillus sp. URB8-2 TaxID=2741301 RepID=UPI001E326D4D|nr:hypothetical protein [Paenibacillus sp. URB8-2]
MARQQSGTMFNLARQGMFVWDSLTGWQTCSSAVFFIESVGYQEVPMIAQAFQLCGLNLRLNRPKKCTFTGVLPRGCFKWKKRCTISGFLPYPAHSLPLRFGLRGQFARRSGCSRNLLRSTVLEESLPRSNICAVIDA